MQESNKNAVFRGGANVAVKMPPDLFEDTVSFYRDKLGLKVCCQEPDSVSFDFGSMRLWIDRSDRVDSPETWLELRCTDQEAAARYLDRWDVPRCDHVERLPEGFPGFWIMAPGGRVHLIHRVE